MKKLAYTLSCLLCCLVFAVVGGYGVQEQGFWYGVAATYVSMAAAAMFCLAINKDVEEQ